MYSVNFLVSLLRYAIPIQSHEINNHKYQGKAWRIAFAVSLPAYILQFYG